jgi:opacity protein-like surface antigen
MLKTSAYFISLFLILGVSPIGVHAQDTIPITLKVKIGLEVSGPAIYYTDKNILSAEGYVSVDLNEKRSAFLALGYLNYKYSQYNYDYLNNGSFLKIGMDFNLLKANKSQGKYFAGIGLRYGLSHFNSETPYYEQTNYWGTTSSSLPEKSYWGHFLEVAPGVRAEIFKNFSVGWTISIRKIIFTNTGKDLKPVYFPGYGDGSKSITAGMSYYLVWNIPYKNIKVIMKKEVQEEDTDDTKDTGTTGNKQQGTGIRQ